MASLSESRRIVVKVGSALLVEDGKLRVSWLNSLAEDVAWLKREGKDVALVSSGAIALGRAALGLPDGPLPLEKSQAAAAVGQIRLARAYEEVLAPFEISTAQVLVTLEDSADRRRYLNSRATLEQLLGLGAVPIVNENDTVATDEIRFGDNDRLAAQIAVTVGADVLVLLSDVDGLYSAAGGAAMVITKGSVLNPLKSLANGASATWFAAETDPQAARKRWIAAMKPKGEFHVDAGAVSALFGGKSLLPAGVTGVSGTFGRGEPVVIVGPDGSRLGVGLTRYTSDEADRIRGERSDRIEAILGYPGRAALVHRDDMAI